MKRVAITGGIGSGKSTVCRALSEVSSAPIYDSDNRAKEIMASHPAVRSELVALFGEEVFEGGVLNRGLIVHPRVVEDFECWAESQTTDYVILESALLFTSPLVGHYDLAVVVDAPLEMRIERCIRRDMVTREQVTKRIESQMSAEHMFGRADIVVEGDGREVRQAGEGIDHIIRQR